MGEGIQPVSTQEQAEMESRLVQTWARGFSETGTIEQIFGPYEDWSLTLGTHLLLLHPVRKEWLVLDRLHDTWEPTGFGPGEVVFVAHGKRLGFLRKKASLGSSVHAMDQRTSVAAGSEQRAPRFCRFCGTRVRADQRFCTQCGTPLT